jgi:exodeoxyribonuclease V alpha subunit
LGLVGETDCIFLAGLHGARARSGRAFAHPRQWDVAWPWIDPEKALPWVEQRTGLTLAESQTAAVRLALIAKVLVITGGPGVGKTTIVNSILRILAAKGVRILLCAPTGRAAKRMSKVSDPHPRRELGCTSRNAQGRCRCRGRAVRREDGALGR